MIGPKLLLAASLTTLLAPAGCKKASDGDVLTKQSDEAHKAAAQEPEAPAAPAVPVPVAPEVTSEDDYTKRATAHLDQLTAAFEAGGTECDKLATSLLSYAAVTGAEDRALNAYEALHPESKQRFEDATVTPGKKVSDEADAAQTKCKDNPKLQAAIRILR